MEVPVWERLDRASGWAELATQAASDSIVQHVASFQPYAVLGIDWSSLPAYKALAAALQYKGLHVPPYIFMNYRCGAQVLMAVHICGNTSFGKSSLCTSHLRHAYAAVDLQRLKAVHRTSQHV